MSRCTSPWDSAVFTDIGNADLKLFIDISQTAQRMSETTKRLAESIKACNSQRITEKDDKAVLSQAHEMQALAKELQDALAKLRLDHSRGRRAAISKAVQSRWNASKIERLEKKLRRQQEALDTLLLKDVKYRLIPFSSF